MNIVQVQNQLKDLSDQQLAGQMQSGEVPAYLVVAEFDRRKRIRNSAVPAEQPTTTVADDALMGGVAALPVAEAPAFASGGIVSFENGGTPGRTMRYKGQDYPVNERGQVLFNGQWVSPSTLGLRTLVAPVVEHFGRVSDKWENTSVVDGLTAATEGYGQGMQGNVPQWQQRLRSQAVQPTPAEVARQNAMGVSLVDQIPTGPAPAAGGVHQVPPPNANAGGGGPRVEDTGIAGALGDQTAPAPTSRAAAPAAKGIMGLAEQYMEAEPPEVSTAATDKAAQELRDSLKGREKDNLNMALMQAGFAMMAGTSPYAFENMGKGAMAGLQAYAEGKKDIDDLKKEISALEISAEKARNEGNMVKYRDDMAKLQLMIGLENSALDRATRENIAASTGSRAANSEKRAAMTAMTSLSAQLQRLMQARGQSFDPADRADIDAQIAQVRSQMEMYASEFGLPYAQTPTTGSSIQDQAAAELERRRAAAR